VAGLQGDEAAAEDDASLRDRQLAAARFVQDFLAAGYGPHGAAKLVVPDSSGDATWVRSPALALRETRSGPLLAPYVDLAARIHQQAGDGATTGVLLCARLVDAALRDPAPTIPSWLEGYRLAWRQARAWLAANEASCEAEVALANVAEPAWAGLAIEGLRRLKEQGTGPLDLDQVDVRAEPEGPAWLDGVVLAAKEPPRAEQECGVLLLTGGWRAKPRAEGTQATLRSADALQDLAAAEVGLRRRAKEHLDSLGVGLLVCSKAVDEGLRGLLLDAGVTVWTDAPAGAMRRIARATGATAVARLEDALASDLGRAQLVRRPRRLGWLVRGKGPSATFAVPAHSRPAADAAVESGERLLRAAGAVLAGPQGPRALVGGGRWQRQLAGALRKAADHAPGKAPIAVHAAADAIDSLADDLLRNAGRDPLDGGTLPQAGGVSDPARCVRAAIDGAFETAIALLRLDGAYAKRPSTPAALRGGMGPAGSPKGMPGDLPPLM
jgi:chaperonin GroEL (HSP60 family)